MTSDQVIWSEQGRLHINLAATVTTKGAGLVTFATAHELRVGDTVIIHETGGGNKINCYVTAIPSTTTANAITIYSSKSRIFGSSFLDNDASNRVCVRF